jgi:hypothetical protein
MTDEIVLYDASVLADLSHAALRPVLDDVANAAQRTGPVRLLVSSVDGTMEWMATKSTEGLAFTNCEGRKLDYDGFVDHLMRTDVRYDRPVPLVHRETGGRQTRSTTEGHHPLLFPGAPQRHDPRHALAAPDPEQCCCECVPARLPNGVLPVLSPTPAFRTAYQPRTSSPTPRRRMETTPQRNAAPPTRAAEVGGMLTGVEFYRTLANVHTSVVKSVAEGIENAIGAKATQVDLRLCRGADLYTAEREDASMFVVSSDTHIANIRDTLQFAHRPDSERGTLSHFGIGSKVLMTSLGPDVQMLVLTKDGSRLAVGRMGPSLDRLVSESVTINRGIVEGHVDAAGRVRMHWGDDADGSLAERRFAMGTPWAHDDESVAKALQRVWTPFLALERVTVFVYYSDGAPLPLDVDSGRLRVVEGDEPRDLACALEDLYVAHASLPAVVVQGVACDFAHHPALHPAVGDGEYAPLHVPGLAAPVAWVRCARLAAARHIDPYHKLERESGAYFTLGDAKVLNPRAPRTYFTGETLGLAGAFDLNLAPFDTGHVRPAQYEEVVRFVSCGDADVAARVRADVDLPTFRTWMPRDAQLWARLGLDVLAHVRVNPALVDVNPKKTEVRLRGEGEGAMVGVLARLRYHVFAWAVADHEGRAFVPPFAEVEAAPPRVLIAPAPLPPPVLVRDDALVPYLPPERVELIDSPPAKRPRLSEAARAARNHRRREAHRSDRSKLAQYDALLAKYNAVRAENQKLRAENRQLRAAARTTRLSAGA